MTLSMQTILIIGLTGVGVVAFVVFLACLKARFCRKRLDIGTRDEREDSLRNRRRITDRMEDPEPDKDKEKPSDANAVKFSKPTLKKDEDSKGLQNEARKESGNRKKVDLSGISGGYGDASILDDILEAIDELTETEEDESSDLNSSQERPLRVRNDAKYVKTNQRKVRMTVAAQVHGRTRNREDPNNTRRSNLNGTRSRSPSFTDQSNRNDFSKIIRSKKYREVERGTQTEDEDYEEIQRGRFSRSTLKYENEERYQRKKSQACQTLGQRNNINQTASVPTWSSNGSRKRNLSPIAGHPFIDRETLRKAIYNMKAKKKGISSADDLASDRRRYDVERSRNSKPRQTTNAVEFENWENVKQVESEPVSTRRKDSASSSKKRSYDKRPNKNQNQDGMNEMYDVWQRQKHNETEAEKVRTRLSDEDMDSTDEFFDTRSSHRVSSESSLESEPEMSSKSRYPVNVSAGKKHSSIEMEASENNDENVFDKWRKITGETSKGTPTGTNHSSGGGGDTKSRRSSNQDISN